MAACDKTGQMSRRLAALKEERGETVRLDEIAYTVEELMTSLEGDLSAVDIALHRELQSLMDYIQRARMEIASIQPTDIPSHHIPAATDELDAVVAATEEATGAILDAAEQVNQLADELGGENADRLRDIATRIYEASNFQDITGQRITKVVRTLRHIEAKVVALVRAFGHDLEASPEAERLNGAAENDDLALLNGPQLPERANSQEDIDALLASFD